MTDLMAKLQAEIKTKGQRPSATIKGHEIAVWWRLAYNGGLYQTEDYNQSSICFAKPGAIALQLVTSVNAPLGSGLMEVPLAPGQRPVFYRVRSIDLYSVENMDIGSRCEGVVYGKGYETDNEWNVDLWCMIPGLPGLDQPVPPHWFDKGMVELQLSKYG